jgi:hypothetical protein
MEARLARVKYRQKDSAQSTQVGCGFGVVTVAKRTCLQGCSECFPALLPSSARGTEPIALPRQPHDLRYDEYDVLRHMGLIVFRPPPSVSIIIAVIIFLYSAFFATAPNVVHDLRQHSILSSLPRTALAFVFDTFASSLRYRQRTPFSDPPRGTTSDWNWETEAGLESRLQDTPETVLR